MRQKWQYECKFIPAVRRESIWGTSTAAGTQTPVTTDLPASADPNTPLRVRGLDLSWCTAKLDGHAHAGALPDRYAEFVAALPIRAGTAGRPVDQEWQ